MTPLDNQNLHGDSLLQSLAEASHDCVMILGLDEKVQILNARAAATMQAVEGRPWLSFWPLEHQAQAQATLDAAKRGEASRFAAARPALAGTPRSWDVLVSPLRRGPGAPVGMIATLRDVAQMAGRRDGTAARAATARVEETERFTRGVIDGMTASICVLDDQGTIIEANEAWRAFRKNNPSSVGGDGLGIDYRASCRRTLGRTGAHLARALDDIFAGRRASFEAEYPFHAPGLKRWVKLHAYRIPGDGPMRVVVMHQPITDLKLSEQRLRRANSVLRSANRAAKTASEAKSAFLATMSHEIRTPLNGVLGMAQAMAADELPDAQRQRLDIIRHSGEALLVLLNDVLDLSKVEAGRLDLEDGLVDLEEIADGVRAAFSSLAADKAVYFGLEVTPAARGLWRGDPVRVRQVLYNLVSNAVKFTERGAIQVEVSHDGRQLILRVADTGPGVPLAVRVKLFTKFTQADASTTRRYGGTGLGLAICRELVQLMGGEIGLDSIVGEGSTFCVRLPLARAEAPPPAPLELLEPPPARGHTGLRVLAAEDNPMNVMVLKTLLGQVGIEPYVVTDGAQAVAAWESSDWDLILMDVQMPVMDGPAAARRIRALEQAQRARRTPIIALTANAMSHHHAEYAAAGMDALCAKPINLAQLLATMDRVVSLDETEPEGQAACA